MLPFVSIGDPTGLAVDFAVIFTGRRLVVDPVCPVHAVFRVACLLD